MADDIVIDESVDVNSDAADAEIAKAMAAEENKKPTSDEESSPAEPKEADPADKPVDKPAADADKGTEDKPAEDADPDKPAEADAADKGDEAKPAKGAESRKAQLQSEIRQLVADRDKARADVATENAKHYAAETPEELVEKGVDPIEARFQAQEQKEALREYNTKVADLNQNINIESLQIMADFPMYNPGTAAEPNPDFNENLSELAKETYNKAAGIEVDENTKLIVNANLMPYEVYKSFADAYAMGTQAGTIKGEQAADKNEAAADTPSSAAPKPKKTDPFLAGLQS